MRTPSDNHPLLFGGDGDHAPALALIGAGDYHHLIVLFYVKPCHKFFSRSNR
jgi:hypothetical protein